ncbi:proline racemase family protein [Halobacterium hubeiense]|uniref:proline racemase family protein n=1 Tax=Halobacterium hubeiense TaxID=1407499 RepID=UPI003C7865F1
MNTEFAIQTIDTHTAGEPTRIVTDGLDRSLLTADGRSVKERRDAFAEHADDVREFLMQEPRGHADMFGAVLLDPEDPTADVGAFFMDAGGYLDMCGHGTIGLVSALIRLGRLPERDVIRVETPAGLVEATPQYDGGDVVAVTVQNVSSFVYDAVDVTVSGIGDVHVDVVYAGNFFALVDADELGIPVTRETLPALVEHGLEIRDAVNDTLDIVHPFTGEAGRVSIAELYASGADADRSAVVFGNGQVDRSPCGTGTCAKMTLLYAHDELELDEPYTHESPLGTRFEGRLVDAETREERVVTTPTITGSARITGDHTFLKEPADQLTGFDLPT